MNPVNIAEKRFLKQLGDRIRERRTALNLTQAELAEKCQLHRTFIGSVERGERNVSVLNLWAIAKALRMSVGEVFNEEKAGEG